LARVLPGPFLFAKLIEAAALILATWTAENPPAVVKQSSPDSALQKLQGMFVAFVSTKSIITDYSHFG
jgi:hypothetical protein